MSNNSSNLNQWIEIGVIVSPHGLRGEVKVSSESDFPERFEEPGQRWLLYPHQATPQPIELLGGYQVPGKNIYVVKIKDINYRDEAEKLKGAQLLVDQADLPELDEDEYHVSELINLEVYHQQTGENIGFVVDLFTAGHDLLEVQLHQQPILEATPEPDLTKVTRKSKIQKIQKQKNKKIKPVTILIPFVKEIVPIIDLEAQKIYINPPDGLLDIKN
jgi:16S rRNA processing protein RimM